MNGWESLVEELSAIEHERWSHWQRHVHGKGEKQLDGSLLIPAEFVERWERQMNTPYSELSESERNSDREQVMRYLPILRQYLKSNDLGLPPDWSAHPFK